MQIPYLSLPQAAAVRVEGGDRKEVTRSYTAPQNIDAKREFLSGTVLQREAWEMRKAKNSNT